MPSQAAGNDTIPIPNYQSLKTKFERLLGGNDSFRHLKFRKGCAWTPLTLIVHAILWLVGYHPTLTEQFEASSDALNAGDEKSPRRSFQAFIKMLRRWTTPLVLQVTLIFHDRMQTKLSDQFTSRSGWLIFGVDGTCLALARTQSNQAGFCAPKKAKPKKSKKPKSQTQAKTKKPKPQKAEQGKKQEKKKLGENVARLGRIAKKPKAHKCTRR